MRSDMYDVLTEGARCGSRDNFSSRKRARDKQKDYGDLPSFEGKGKALGDIVGWSRRHSGGISSSILRRFLQSNIGRPWDKVFSEFSEHIKITGRRWTEREIFSRFSWILHENVMIAVPDKHGRNIWDLERGYYISEGDFYIHPKTGILHRFLLKKKENRIPNPPAKPRLIGAWQILIQRDLNKDKPSRNDRLNALRRPNDGLGPLEEPEPNLVWYLVDLAPIPGFERTYADRWYIQRYGWPEEARDVKDVFFGVLRHAQVADLEALYKKLGVYGKRKKQLSRREMKRYGVWRQE